MSAVKYNENNFNEIREREGISLIDFYADWCGPCRMVMPIVEEIASEREDLLVAKINVDDNPELAREFGIYSIPTLVVMKDGEVDIEAFCNAYSASTYYNITFLAGEGGKIERYADYDGLLYVDPVADEGYEFDGYYLNGEKISGTAFNFNTLITVDVRFVEK